MINYAKILKEFPEDREKKLRDIRRFSMFEVMFYRSTLWHHALRVYLMLDELLKMSGKKLPNLDFDKARVLALVHDDAEIITGDVQLGHKQRMSKRELKAVTDNEAKAIEKLSKIYPVQIGGYNYKDLLLSILQKDTIEAQLVSYADKLDAYCESLHEVFGGNISALRAVINYVGVLKDFDKKYPKLKPILNSKDSFLSTTDFYTDMWKVHRKDYIFLGKPHTKKSILKPTQFVLYNKWKEFIIKNLGNEGIEILTKKVRYTVSSYILK